MGLIGRGAEFGKVVEYRKTFGNWVVAGGLVDRLNGV